MSAYTDAIAADGATSFWRCADVGPNLAPTIGASTLAPSGSGILYQRTALDGSLSVELPGSAGGAGYFSTADHADLDLGDIFTLEAWIKLGDDLGVGNFMLFDKGANSYTVRMPSSRSFQLMGSATLMTICSSRVKSTEWHHVVITKNNTPTSSTGILCYLDGIDRTASYANLNSVFVNNALALVIGRANATAADYFKGRLHDLAIYKNVILTPTQVSNHYRLKGPDANSNSSATTTTTNLLFGLNVAAGANLYLLVNAAIRLTAGQSVTGVTWTPFGGATQALALIQRTANGAAAVAVEQWGLVNPVVGAGSISVSINAAGSFGAGAHALTAINQTTPTRLPPTGVIGTSTAPAVTPTGGVNGDTVLDIVAVQDSGGVLTPGGSQTQQWQEHTIQATLASNVRLASSKRTWSGGSGATLYTHSISTPWAIQSLALVPAGGGVVTQSAVIPYEGLGARRASGLIPYELLKSIFQQRATDYEGLSIVTLQRILAYEALGRLTGLAAIPYEGLVGLRGSASISIEGLKVLTQSRITAYEALTAIVQSRIVAYEALLRVRGSSPIPYEGGIPVGETTSVSQLALILYEALKPLRELRVTPYEGLKAVVGSRVVSWEALKKAQASLDTNYEGLKLLGQSYSVPYEALKRIQGLAVVPYESAKLLSKPALFLYEALLQVRRTGIIPYEGGIPTGATTVFLQTPLDIIEHDHSLFVGVSLFLDVMLSTSNVLFAARAQLEVSIDGGAIWTPLITASSTSLPVAIDSPINSVFIGQRVRSTAVPSGSIPQQSALYRVTLGGVTNAGANIYRIYHAWGLITG